MNGEMMTLGCKFLRCIGTWKTPAEQKPSKLQGEFMSAVHARFDIAISVKCKVGDYASKIVLDDIDGVNASLSIGKSF